MKRQWELDSPQLHPEPSDGSAAAKSMDVIMNAGKYLEAVARYDPAIVMNPGLSDIPFKSSVAKQLARGMIRANLSVAEPVDTVGLNSGKGLPFRNFDLGQPCPRQYRWCLRSRSP